MTTELREAIKEAEQIATEYGIEVRMLTEPYELAAVETLLCDVWITAHPPLRAPTLRAMVYSGCYVAGAFSVEDPQRMLGTCIAFFADPGRQELHSHITGVRSEARGRRVGLALKLHQRAWALERGVRTISWTYDPLLRRNASFNLTHLGATAKSYFVDFYGGMHDEINNGESSDRILVEWDLQSPHGAEITRRDVSLRHLIDAGAHRLLVSDENGAPRLLEPAAASSIALVHTPVSAERMRRADPALSRTWRLALRSALAPLLATGTWAITGFTSEEEGWYIVESAQ